MTTAVTAAMPSDLAQDSPMTDDAAPTHLVPSYPSGSTFLIGVEVCLWTLYTVGMIMVMVVVMMT